MLTIIKMLTTRQIIGFLGVIGSLVIALGLSTARAAGNATLTLVPASGSYQVNTTFTINVYEDSGSVPTNAAEADITYDASKLQFVSVSTSGTAFDGCPQATGGGGNITISCAALGNKLTGSQRLGAVTLKALAGSGATTLNFRSDSAVLAESDSSNIWNGNTSGASYSFTTPPPAPAPTPAPTPTPSPQPKAKSVTTTTPPAAAKPTTTPQASGYSAASPAAQQSNPAAPVPVGEISSAEQGNGYMVAIKVVNQEGKIVKNAKVTMASKTVVTDASGTASFTNVPLGKYAISVDSKKGQAKSSIEITNDGSPTDVQKLTVKLEKKVSVPYILIPPALLLVGLAATLPSLYDKLSLRKISSKSSVAEKSPDSGPDFGTPTVVKPTIPPKEKA